MTRFALAACAAALILSTTACGPDDASDHAVLEPPVADLSGLEAGWNTIEASGDTTCSDGSPYQFFVRPGDPDKLAFYLQGGGGCWNGSNCERIGSISGGRKLTEGRAFFVWRCGG